MSFGARLRKERLRRHLSQEALAEALGTIAPTISRWERDQTFPRAYHRLALCRLFQMRPEELFEELDAREQADSVLPPLWHVPYPRNPFFTGREEVLQRLHEMLNHKQTLALTQSLAVSGLGGIGKTQIALEYAYRYANSYTAVFWINAETRESLSASFVALADLLDVPGKQEREQERVIAAVARWLTGQHQWLLIFDNVEEIELVKRCLPSAHHGSLLFTTRRQALGISAQTLDLEQMNAEEGVRLLLHRARLLAPTAPLDALAPADEAAARAIVAEMDGLPLALDQAGAYIEATRCSLSDYLHLFQSTPLRLLDERGAHVEHPHSVSRTFTLIFEQVEERHAPATEVLTACAFLAPEAIPESFLLEGSAHLGPVFEALAAHPLQFQDAMKTLLASSLLQRDTATHTLTIHRLVQAVLRDRLSETAQRAWAAHMIRAMIQIFPVTRTQAAYWQTCERLLPHALVCIALGKQWETDATDCITLMSNVAAYFISRAQFGEAEQLYQQALYLGEQELAPLHLLIAKVLGGLASLSFQRGKYEAAELFCRRALNIQERALDAGDLKIALTLTSLATIYLDQGKYKEAEPLYQRALQMWEQTGKPGDLQMTFVLNNLANLYVNQEKYEEAKRLAQRALHLLEHDLGPDDPQLAVSLIHLGRIFKAQGSYVEAKSYYQRAVSLREKVLGTAHPQLVYPLSGLADLYREQGKYEQAEQLFLCALRILDQSLGSDHPEAVYTLNGLAKCFFEQKRFEEAEVLYERTWHIWEHLSMPDHPFAAETLYGWASLYAAQGRYVDAMPLYQRVLALYERSLGSHHPKTVETRTRYLALLRTMGREEDAAIQTESGKANYEQTS